MSVDELITQTLSVFGYDIDNSVGFSRNDTYFAFNCSTLPIGFGDDAPDYERYMVQVHLFAPLDMNLTKLKAKIKHALFNVGFTWPGTEDASDKDGRHIVFECQFVKEVDGDGDA